MSLESGEEPGLIVSDKTLTIAALIDSANRRRREDRFAHGIAGAVAAQWIKRDRCRPARQPTRR